MTEATRMNGIGYAFATVLTATGWDGPIGDLGMALAAALTLINCAAFLLLLADARRTARPEHGP